MLKPALSRGELQCIGATTLDEYRKYIEKDGALERRFQPVKVDEPTLGGDDRDPEGPPRPVRGAPPCHDHRRGARGGRQPGRPLHHRPVPARQGDRRDRRGRRRVCASAHDDPARPARARDADRRGAARPRKRAIDDQEFEEAGRLRDQEKSAARREGRPRRSRSRPRASIVRRGRRRGHRRGGLAVDRHPGLQAHRGGDRASAAHGGRAAQADRRPGEGRRRRVAGDPPHPRRPQGPQASHRLVHLPRPHRRRQDRAGQDARRVPVRRRRLR